MSATVSTASPPVAGTAVVAAGSRILPVLLVALLSGCARAADDPPPPAGSIWTTPLLNDDFELVADSTTEPPKYGAYWLGAFVREAGDATSLVVERNDGRGHALALGPGDAVTQKLAVDPRWTEHLAVELQVRLDPSAVLEVALEDGPGRRTAVQVVSPPDGVDAERGTDEGIIPVRSPPGDGWLAVSIDLGRRFVAQHGERPTPRLRLHLSRVPSEGGDGTGATVDVDDVTVTVPGPALEAHALRATIEDLVRWQLETWFLPEGEGGLGLVDPDTGYVTAVAYDVETGSDRTAARTVSFHTIHNLLILWLREAHRRGDADEIARWTPHLATIVSSLLANNFDPVTGLPRTIWRDSGEPNNKAAVTVGAYIDFLLDAAELLDGTDQRAELADAARDRCRVVADALLALQAAHDLPPEEVENAWRIEDGVVLVGDFPNWYGHIPPKLTPSGDIDTPRRFNTAWAIVTQRKFWYHVFKSPAAIMRVNEVRPGPDDLAGIRRVGSLYERQWDAARYQLENDTDDHYGYLCEDLLVLLEHGDGQTPHALQLVQEATDHRLARDAEAGETLWVQGVRLGTACAGDSPRAFKGLADLYALPPQINAATSGLPMYRDALLELAANDFLGRQLTNGQFTESFFEDWEMVCICYRGNLQGDCRHPPPEGWHGDVGDTFGGPPTTGIDAQVQAYRVADASQRPAILARLGTILHVTESTMRREYGYLFGLDTAVARQYELPEKYTHGTSAATAAGLGYVMAWARLLPQLDSEP